MTRAALLCLLLSGCAELTRRPYYRVDFINDTQERIVICERDRHEGTLICADPYEAFSCAVDGGTP